MESIVEVGEGVTALSESAPGAPAPNQAGEVALAEHAKVMSDKTHPMYAGYHRNPIDPQAEAYVAELYRKAYGAAPARIGGESLSVGSVEPQPGETPEAAEIRVRNEVILATLKQEWGPDYERRFAGAIRTAQTLFHDRGDLYDELGSIVRMEYGPKGETAVLRLFHELETIKQGG